MVVNEHGQVLPSRRVLPSGELDSRRARDQMVSTVSRDSVLEGRREGWRPRGSGDILSGVFRKDFSSK